MVLVSSPITCTVGSYIVAAIDSDASASLQSLAI